MNFLLNNPAPAVRALLSEVRLRIDPDYRGECARLFEDPSARKRYFRRSGLTLDQFGERLWDRGIVGERPTPDEILCYLDELFRPQVRRPGRKRATAGSIEADYQHAKNVRSRLYQCSTCGQKLRGTRKTCVPCGRCLPAAFATIAEEVARITGNPALAAAILATVRECIQPMPRIDLLPEEILAQSFATMEGTAA